MDKVYHYTNIGSLALILKNRTIRLNCLKNVDDMEECFTEDYPNLSSYVFASSWTNKNRENIALWNMYTDKMAGVRIGMPGDMLNLDLDEDDFVQNGILSGNSKSEDYLIYGHRGYSPIQVSYKSRNEKKKFLIVREEKGKKEFAIQSIYLGLVKDKQWSFQQESRFLVSAVKKNKSFSSWNKTLYFFSSQLAKEPIALEYIDLPLKMDALNQMEILLGPNCNASDQIIVDSLLCKYLPTNKNQLRKSNLKIQLH